MKRILAIALLYMILIAGVLLFFSSCSIRAPEKTRHRMPVTQHDQANVRLFLFGNFCLGIYIRNEMIPR